MASTLRPKDIGCSLLNYFWRLRPPLACRRAEAACPLGLQGCFQPAALPRSRALPGTPRMVPLYQSWIEDLGSGDLVKVDCAACSHTALLSTTFLLQLGIGPRDRCST